MTNKIDVLYEIYNRLLFRMTAGQPLENLKVLRIGTIEDARKFNDLPVINIQLSNGQESAKSTHRIFVDKMTVIITIIHTKIQGNNTLFTEVNGQKTGPLAMLEKVLNALDKKIDDTIDLSFSGYADGLRDISYSINEDEFVAEIQIVLNVSSKQFFAGGR